MPTSFIVAPSPHPEDKDYCIENGVNYFPSNEHVVDLIQGDVGGILHELFVPVNKVEPILKKVERRHIEQMKKLTEKQASE